MDLSHPVEMLLVQEGEAFKKSLKLNILFRTLFLRIKTSPTAKTDQTSFNSKKPRSAELP